MAMSILAAALEASRKGRYATISRPSNAPVVDLNDTVKYPFVSSAEISRMSASIAPALYNISCYEVMGSSTQVVVVEENSPLTIPFIAAQETQVSTCFVWCSARRRYTGVLSMTEYVKVLLYCEANPHAVEQISNLTVREWLELKREQAADSGASQPPEALVSATADESLATCIERMLSSKVRRLAIVADDTEDPRHETSILTVITYDTLMQHVSNRLFSTDIFGNGSGHGNGGAGGALGDLSNGGGLGSPSGGAVPACVQSLVQDGGSGDEGGDNEALGQAVGSATGAYQTIFDVPYARLHRLGRAAQYKAEHGHYPPQVVVGASTPISQALQLMVGQAMHSVAVVDDGNGPIGEVGDGAGRPIIDAVTRHDAIRMETGGVFNLQVSVREALLNATSGGSGGAALSRPPVAVFYESNTLREIVEHFATRRVPVLFLVDPATDGLIAQLSVTEVFSFLSESSTAAAAAAAAGSGTVSP